MTETITVTSHFGGCPECGGNDGFLNAGRTHICYCSSHKVSWIIGANLFSGWRDETEAEQRERYKLIEGYARVVPAPEGTWSTDPEIRRREFEAADQSMLDEEKRRVERCEKVAAFLVDALAPLAADMQTDEKIHISVRPAVGLVLSAAGVHREDVEDFPF